MPVIVFLFPPNCIGRDMQDVMLFGEGWNGEVRQIEDGMQQFRYIPHAGEPKLREVVFTIIGYHANDGKGYLMGWTGIEPLNPDVNRPL